MMMVIIIIIITTTLSRAVAVFISCHFLSTLWVPSRYVLQPPPPPPSFSCAKDASPPRLSQIIYCICVYSKRGKKEYINVAHSIYIFICLSSWAMSPQIALSLRGKQRSERVHMCHGETSTVHLVLHCSIWDAILPFFCVSPLRIFRGICRACVCQATLMRAQFPFPRSYVHFSLFFHFFFCCVLLCYFFSFLHSELSKDPLPCKGRVEWCWSSCSSCHQRNMTGLTNSLIMRSKGESYDLPRNEVDQNFTEVQYGSYPFLERVFFLLGAGL